MKPNTRQFHVSLADIMAIAGLACLVCAVVSPIVVGAKERAGRAGSMENSALLSRSAALYAADYEPAPFVGCLVDDASFATNGSGCMDLATGLTWTDSVYGGLWDVARNKCADLVLDGFTNWRLPTIQELQAVHANGAAGHLGLLDGNHHLFHWSSTKVKASAWALRFDTGESKLFGTKPGGGYLWASLYANCVR